MRIKKIATNIHFNLLNEATKLTGLNQTQALIEGLKELISQKKRLKLLSLKGKLHFTTDIEKSRKRLLT